MASVIIQDQRTIYMEAFLERFLGVTPSTMYLGIGRASVWANESIPPAPVNTNDEVTNFFNDIIAAQQVTSNSITPVIRKIVWESGTEYDLFDDSDDASFTTNFYVVNSEDRVYQVETKVISSVTSTEPQGTGSGNPINTGDGYTWRYLYTLDAVNQTLATNNWLPVAYGASILPEQTSDGDVNAYRTLGVNHILVQSEVSDPLISDSLTYRQIALLSDITDNSDVVLSGSAELAANIKESGYVLHIENRTPITRASGQTETFQTILKIF